MKLCKKNNLDVVDYTVAPIFMKGKEKGGHQWFIEFKNMPSKSINLEKEIDENLKQENSDYEAKLRKDFTLDPPKIIIGNKGVFLKWLKKNNKMGGQNKVPRLSNNRELIEQLIKLNN